MSKPFDAILKGMLEASPSDWPVFAGQPRCPVEVIDADVSTFTGAADKVLRLQSHPESILHFDFQAGPDATLPRRTHVYNALLEDRHDRLVRSVVVLLRPEANLSNLTGVYQSRFDGEKPYLWFRYLVIRVWQLPVDQLLAGGQGTLPLAPISAVRQADLPGVIDEMKRRVRGRQSRAEATGLWAATYVLMGLRYARPMVDQHLEGVISMEESVTYQAILAKGKEEGLRQGGVNELKNNLMLQGQEKFGAPDRKVQDAIGVIDDLERLRQLSVRLLHVTNWRELLELPSRRKKS